MTCVEHIVVIGTSEAPLPGALDYDALLAACLAGVFGLTEADQAGDLEVEQS